MKEYRINVKGMYDVIVVSPKIIDTLIHEIQYSTTRELIIPAEEVLPQGYTEYLTCVLNANAEIAALVPDGNIYKLIAGQIRELRCNEQDCFDRVEVTGGEGDPRFDMDTSENFYFLTKQENNRFRFVPV